MSRAIGEGKDEGAGPLHWRLRSRAKSLALTDLRIACQRDVLEMCPKLFYAFSLAASPTPSLAKAQGPKLLQGEA
eukprot:3711803-Rhodomonas_salina.1